MTHKWQAVLWHVETQRHETLELVAETSGQASAIVARPGVEVRAVTHMHAVTPFERELLSTGEACAYTGWSRGKLWRLRCAGHLDSFKDAGGSISWRKADLDAIREGRSAGKGAASAPPNPTRQRKAA